MGLNLIERGHVACQQQNESTFSQIREFESSDREFGGKEQQEKPRVREFRELWIVNLRGLSVYLKIHCFEIHCLFLGHLSVSREVLL